MRLTADSLSQLSGVQHGFFTRHGGVSEGVYASLNCGGNNSRDSTERITENRRRAMVKMNLNPADLCTIHQVHSPDVVTVTGLWDGPAAPHADGMVTSLPGLILGILTADCAPILLADSQAGVIGAAHAGWRGARTGVIEATVTAMEVLGAQACGKETFHPWELGIVEKLPVTRLVITHTTVDQDGVPRGTD